MLIEWMDMFSVGDDRLDADHQRLLDILNRLYEAWANGHGQDVIAAAFTELADYTARHFSHEERLLEEIGYDRLDVQKREHARLLEQLQAFRARHVDGDDLGPLTQEVVDFLRSWMIDHILQEDMRYKEVVTEAS